MVEQERLIVLAQHAEELALCDLLGKREIFKRIVANTAVLANLL
jgi:hypothetical protein